MRRCSARLVVLAIALATALPAEAARRRPRHLSTTVGIAAGIGPSAGHYVWDELAHPKVVKSLDGKSAGTKILWWNIQYGALNKQLAQPSLDLNLRRLATGAGVPDVIALGEFQYDAVAPETLAVLRESYAAEKFVPYSEHSAHRGVMVFSKQKFKSVRLAPIDYTPSDRTSGEQESYRASWKRDYEAERYFKRQFIRLSIEDQDGAALDLVPLHTVQPWEKLEQRHSSRLLGRLHAGLALLFGKRNPLIHQLRRFRTELERRFAATIVFGDLNLIRKWGPFQTPSYRLVSRGLVDPFADDPTPSFPAVSAPAFGGFHLQIDRFLATPDLAFQDAHVVPLQGSDHYPILLTGVRAKHPSK